MSRAFSAVGAKLPKGWGDFGRQIAILVSVDLAYTFVRGIVDSEKGLAMTHGLQVIDFERSIGTFFEPSLQEFFLPAQWVIDFANQVYLNAQFSIALGFLLWLYLFRNQSYYFVRNMFVAAMGLALVGYTLYPTAPPRMFPSSASSTRSTTSPTSITTPRWRKSSSTPTRRCRACTAPSR